MLQNPVLAKRHTANVKASEEEQKLRKEAQKDIKSRRQKRKQNLVKPSVLQQGHERKLRRVATRGGKGKTISAKKCRYTTLNCLVVIY